VGVPYCRPKIEDVLECLRQDEAVEELARNVIGGGEVGDESRRLVRRVEIEHVAPLDGDTEALRVVRVQHLEYPSADGVPLGLEERLYVVAVDRRSALAAPMVAERRRPANRAKPGGMSKALPPPTPAKRIAVGGRECLRPPTHTADVTRWLGCLWASFIVRDEARRAIVRDTRYLIVNADDFGYSRSVNRGVIEAHERGIVTSASLMVDRPGAVEAAKYAREHPPLGVGLHLELDAWRVARIPRKGAVRSTAALVRRVAAQSSDQLERFRSLVGRDPSHLDSHQHRHVWDDVRPVLERLADELDVPLRRCDARVRFCGDFYGHDGRGQPDPDAITPEALVALLARLEPGVTELCCHAGYAEDLDDWYRMEREQEVRTLCSAAVRETVAKLEIELCTFEVVGSLRVGASRT
jgi:predicted glycoside hydrolase/deacetylase ChbG (UPF0249 family)